MHLLLNFLIISNLFEFFSWFSTSGSNQLAGFGTLSLDFSILCIIEFLIIFKISCRILAWPTFEMNNNQVQLLNAIEKDLNSISGRLEGLPKEQQKRVLHEERDTLMGIVRTMMASRIPLVGGLISGAVTSLMKVVLLLKSIFHVISKTRERCPCFSSFRPRYHYHKLLNKKTFLNKSKINPISMWTFGCCSKNLWIVM